MSDPARKTHGRRVVLALLAAIACGVGGLTVLARVLRERPLPPACRGPAHDGPSAWPLMLDASGRCLVDRRGAPFFVQGEAAWSLIVGLTREEVLHYLADRRARGFNTLLVNLIEHQFGGPADRYGHAPFVTPEDFSTPDDRYFDHAVWVVERAAEHGFLVLLAPAYVGYAGTAEGWYDAMRGSGPAKCREYGRYVGRRFARAENVLWVHGGDAPPREALSEIEAVLHGIREAGATQLYTAHSKRGRSALDDYNRAWLSVNTTYTGEPVLLPLQRDYRRSGRKPFFHIEGRYENEKSDERLLLDQAYYPMMWSAQGHVFGNRPIWLFDAGWREALGSRGAELMRHQGALMRSRAWWRLVPDTDRRVVTAGYGDVTRGDALAAARDAAGRTIMVYVPEGPRTFTVDLSQASGSAVRVWWYDPRTGTARQAGDLPTGGARPFTTPGAGEWVLVLDDASQLLPPPGTGVSLQ